MSGASLLRTPERSMGPEDKPATHGPTATGIQLTSSPRDLSAFIRAAQMAAVASPVSTSTSASRASKALKFEKVEDDDTNPQEGDGDDAKEAIRGGPSRSSTAKKTARRPPDDDDDLPSAQRGRQGEHKHRMSSPEREVSAMMRGVQHLACMGGLTYDFGQQTWYCWNRPSLQDHSSSSLTMNSHELVPMNEHQQRLDVAMKSTSLSPTRRGASVGKADARTPKKVAPRKDTHVSGEEEGKPNPKFFCASCARSIRDVEWRRCRSCSIDVCQSCLDIVKKDARHYSKLLARCSACSAVFNASDAGSHYCRRRQEKQAGGDTSATAAVVAPAATGNNAISISSSAHRAGAATGGQGSPPLVAAPTPASSWVVSVCNVPMHSTAADVAQFLDLPQDAEIERMPQEPGAVRVTWFVKVASRMTAALMQQRCAGKPFPISTSKKQLPGAAAVPEDKVDTVAPPQRGGQRGSRKPEHRPAPEPQLQPTACVLPVTVTIHQEQLTSALFSLGSTPPMFCLS